MRPAPMLHKFITISAIWDFPLNDAPGATKNLLALCERLCRRGGLFPLSFQPL